MNWYKIAHLTADVPPEVDYLDYLLSWVCGGMKKEAAHFTRPTGGHLRHDPTIDKKIVELFEQGMNVQQIMQQTGFGDGKVRGALVRAGKITRNKRPEMGGRGMGSDQVLIDKIKQLSQTVNPKSGKNYNKTQIAQLLGVSYQTVDRIMAKYVRSGPNDLANYVAYQFWETYQSGMPQYVANLPEGQRANFVVKFIDSIFQNPQDRQVAKEALFHKLHMRDKMMALDPNDKFPPPPPGGAAPYIDRGPDSRLMGNNVSPSSIPLQVAAPQQNMAYETRYTRQSQTPTVDRYKAMGRGDLVEQIVTGYKNGKSLRQLAIDLNIKDNQIRNILREMGTETRPSAHTRKTTMQENFDRISQMRAEGKSWEQIGAELGMDRQALSRFFRQNNPAPAIGSPA
jgi:transcriptional regulator with XRE-family HTH domain